VVGPDTDGSWLIVDRGESRTARRAIERIEDEQSAHREAATLSELDDAPAALPAPEPDEDFDAMFAVALEHIGAVDELHNFDHLLRPRP
jgi:hypothetical protein